jgi:lambda family phage portal protein
VNKIKKSSVSRSAPRPASRGWPRKLSLEQAGKIFQRGQQLGYRRGIGNNSAYLPAAETGRVRSDWGYQLRSSTELLRQDFKILASRSEQLYRSNPYFRRAVDILKTFVVGSGLRPFPAVRYGDGDPITGINSRLASDWARFNDQAYRNGSQQITSYEAQGIEFVTMVVLGSWLRQEVKSRPGSVIPRAFTVLKPTRLNFSHDNFYEGVDLSSDRPKIILGQEVNEYAEPTAFWIDNEQTSRPASSMSIHYRPIEAEQYLGIPWLTPVLGNLYDIESLFSDKLTQSRILTRMGIWSKRQDKAALSKLLDNEISDDEESVPFDKAQMYFSDEKPEAIQFDDTIAESFSPLMKMALHAVAIGSGFSYGRLTTDLEGANFSGGRLNSIADSKIFNCLYKYFYKNSCQTLWNRFVNWECFIGRIPGVTYSAYLKDPWYYSQCFWLPEAEQWVDPLKDAQAQNLLYKTGQTTLQELCAAQGKDYHSVIQQRSREKQELIDAGLSELLPSSDAGVINPDSTNSDDNSDDNNF